VGGVIVSFVATVVLAVLLAALAGGFLLRVGGRVMVLAGLIGAVVDGSLLGLLIAAVGGLITAAGGTRLLDRRRPHV
jgi:hypothetical protein